MKRLAIISPILFAVAGCAEEKEPRLPIPKAGDVWLSQESFLERGRFDRVALIFGFADDFSYCLNLVKTYRATFPNAGLRCDQANVLDE